MVDSTSGANIIMQMANKPSIALEDPTKMMQDVEDLRSKQLSNKKSALGLNMEQSNGIARAILAASMDPGATPESMSAEAERLGQLYGVDRRIINSWKSQIQPGMNQQQLQQLGLRATSLALTPSEQYDRSTPQTKLVDKGGQLQPVQINPAMGASPNAITEVGQEITKTNPPTRIDNGQTSTPYDSQNRQAGAPVTVGLPSPGTLDKTVTYTGKDNRTYPISEGELRYRRDNGIDMPADGGPRAGTFAQPVTQTAPAGTAGAPIAATGGYVPRLGQAAPSAAPPPPGAGPIVANTGALNPDGTVNAGGGAAPQGPVVAPPQAAGPTVRTGLQAGGNPLTGQPGPTGLPIAGRTPTGLGPSPREAAIAKGGAETAENSIKQYVIAETNQEPLRQMQTSFKQMYDISKLMVTGKNATTAANVRSSVVTALQNLGFTPPAGMDNQAMLQSLFEKASARVIASNPMARDSLGAIETLVKGNPSMEMQGKAIQQVTMLLMATTRLEQVAYNVAQRQGTPENYLQIKNHLGQTVDPVGLIWDSLGDASDRPAKEAYAGLISQEGTKEAKEAARARLIEGIKLGRRIALPPPGGFTGNAEIAPGTTVPTTPPNIVGGRRVLGAVPTSGNSLQGP